jgi:TRAP-type C4-dicarboxylate transport system substrate-binding protein
MAPEVLVASARSWAKMSAEEQSLLADAARDSVKVMRDIWDQRVADSRKRLLDSGVQLVTDVDHDAFARLMLPVWDRFLLTKEQQQLADDIVSLGEDRA